MTGQDDMSITHARWLRTVSGKQNPEAISFEEHLDRVRRVRSVPCPRCGAGKGQPCRSPSGTGHGTHHQARYGALYARKAWRP